MDRPKWTNLIREFSFVFVIALKAFWKAANYFPNGGVQRICVERGSHVVLRLDTRSVNVCGGLLSLELSPRGVFPFPNIRGRFQSQGYLAH